MDASRTQQVTHGQPTWSWVALGAIGILLAAVIAVSVDRGADDGVVVRTPPAADVPVERPTEDFPLHGRGLIDVHQGVAASAQFAGPATATREGGAYIATGTPDSFTDVREGGAYDGTEQAATPHRGPCPVKAGC